MKLNFLSSAALLLLVTSYPAEAVPVKIDIKGTIDHLRDKQVIPYGQIIDVPDYLFVATISYDTDDIFLSIPNTPNVINAVLSYGSYGNAPWSETVNLRVSPSSSPNRVIIDTGRKISYPQE